MRICPHCSFANEERFPVCIVCNTLLVDVPYTPSADAGSEEFQQHTLRDKRRKATRRHLLFAALLYVVSITGTAVCPGMVFNPWVLALYGACGTLAAAAMIADFSGQFSTSLLQGALSAALALYFGPLQPFIFFMLLGHIVVPAVFWHWIDTVHGMAR